jgi:hypothetical protein
VLARKITTQQQHLLISGKLGYFPKGGNLNKYIEYFSYFFLLKIQHLGAKYIFNFPKIQLLNPSFRENCFFMLFLFILFFLVGFHCAFIVS